MELRDQLQYAVSAVAPYRSPGNILMAAVVVIFAPASETEPTQLLPILHRRMKTISNWDFLAALELHPTLRRNPPPAHRSIGKIRAVHAEQRYGRFYVPAQLYI